VRYLAKRLSRDQHWLLIDTDPRLLAQVRLQMTTWAAAEGHLLDGDRGQLLIRNASWSCSVDTRCAELTADVLSEIAVPGCLISASALLDLVSEEWVAQLARRCRGARAVVLLALTYNGHVSCVPHDPDDEAIIALVNRHQRTDKGFGPALGPEAVECTRRTFSALGFDVECDASEWVLAPEALELQARLIEGWVEAASIIAPAHKAFVEKWGNRRLACVNDGRSAITLGHDDLAAWLP
jgi:hypothetical protein